MIDSNSENKRTKKKVHCTSILTDCWFWFWFFFNIIVVFEYCDSEQNMNHVRQESLNLCITLMACKPQA